MSLRGSPQALAMVGLAGAAWALATPSHAQPPDRPFVSMESIPDAAGWQLVAQDPDGDLWHYEGTDSRDAATNLGSRARGAFAFIRSPRGALRVLAAGPDGAIAIRTRLPGGQWGPWAGLGGTAIVDVAAVPRDEGAMMVRRNVQGTVEAAELRKDGKVSEWRRVADGVTRPPAIASSPEGRPWILFVTGDGLLQAAGGTNAGTFMAPVTLASQVEGRPSVALDPSGRPWVFAASGDGTLMTSGWNANAWSRAASAGALPARALQLRAQSLPDGTFVTLARDEGGRLWGAALAGAPLALAGQWADLPFDGGDTPALWPRDGHLEMISSRYVRLRMGALAGRFVLPLTISGLAPETVWDGDDMSVDFTLRNIWGAVADGRMSATFAGRDGEVVGTPVVPLDPAPLPCPGGGGAQPCRGRFRFSSVPAGAQKLVVSYRKMVTKEINVPGRPIVITDLSSSQWAVAEQPVDVNSFAARLGTDAAPVALGAWRCQDVSPDVLQSCGQTLCDPTGKLGPPMACSAGCPPAAVPSHPYNHQLDCRGPASGQPGGRVEPASQIAVQDAIRSAAAQAQRVRVVGSQHSANAQLCSQNWILSTAQLKGSGSGPIPICQWPAGVSRPRAQLLTPCLEQLNGQEVVQVAVGDNLFEFVSRLYRSGRSLGYAIPGFRLATVGGTVATGTHGSSPVHPAVISTRVESVTLVRADGSVEEATATRTTHVPNNPLAVPIESQTAPDTWKALRAHLGFMGVVTRLGLRVEPAFNLRTSWSWHAWKKEEDVDPFGLVQGCDYATLTWFPGTQEVLRLCGVRTEIGDPNASVDPRAENWLFRAPKDLPELPQIGKITQQDMARMQVESVCGQAPVGPCFLENMHAALLRHSLPPMGGVDCGATGWADVVARLADVPLYSGDSCSGSKVGPAHLMVSSEVPPVTDDRGRPVPLQRDWEIFVPAAGAVDALKAVYRQLRADGTCLPLLGVFLRFAPTEDGTLVAHTAATATVPAGQAGMFIEMPVVLPRNMKCSDQARYEEPYSRLAERLVVEFGGRPHWAKNRASLLQLVRQRDVYGDNMLRFRRAVAAYDPRGVFANQFGVDIGLRWPLSPPVQPEAVTLACLPD